MQAYHDYVEIQEAKIPAIYLWEGFKNHRFKSETLNLQTYCPKERTPTLPSPVSSLQTGASVFSSKHKSVYVTPCLKSFSDSTSP